MKTSFSGLKVIKPLKLSNITHTMNRLLTLLFLFTLAVRAETKVTFVEDPFPPYTIGKAGQKPTGGIAVKVIEKIFEQLPEAEPEFILLPWKRALAQVEQGNIDALMHLLKTEEREKKYIFTDSIYTSYSVVFYSKQSYPDGISWDTLEDLKQYKICINDGYAIHDMLKKKNDTNSTQKYTIYPVTEKADCFKQLDQRRADIHIGNKANVIAFLKTKEMMSNYGITNKPVYNRKVYIAFSKKSSQQKLIPKINKIISRLKMNGTIHKLIQAEYETYR